MHKRVLIAFKSDRAKLALPSQPSWWTSRKKESLPRIWLKENFPAFFTRMGIFPFWLWYSKKLHDLREKPCSLVPKEKFRRAEVQKTLKIISCTSAHDSIAKKLNSLWGFLKHALDLSRLISVQYCIMVSLTELFHELFISGWMIYVSC